MCQPSFPWGAQDACWAGFSRAMTWVPGSASGVLLKSNAPWSWAQAESWGLILDVLSRFNVSRACGRSLSQRCIGKESLVEQRPAIK